MQGEERMDRQLLDAEMLAGHLVPAGSMFAFLAAHRGEVFPDEDFADLFPSDRGRPSVPATVMAAVMSLQALHDYSDRETAEAVRFDVRWKVACGLAVDDEGFDPSTLVYWRRRMARSERPHRINDAVRKIVAETGILRGRRRRAVDSTILADAVSTQDTITQLVSAVRRVAREVPGAAEQVAAVCTGHDYSAPGKPKIDWDDPGAKDVLVSALVNDASALAEALKDAELGEQAACALGLLALVAGQDVEPAEDSDGTDGRWRIARKVASDRVISTVDPDSRHVHKSRHRQQDGYKAHVVIEPGTGLFTGGRLTKASGEANHEAVVGVGLLAGEDAGLQVLGDTAYGTGQARADLAAAGHTAVIKPGPLKPAVDGGFTIDDFTADEQAGTVTCPNGVTRRITRARRVVFGVACRSCPLRPQCTTSAKGRTLELTRHDALLRQARRDWAARQDLRDTYRQHRPMVERSIAWLIGPKSRCRQLRYRGVSKNDQWLHLRMTALNLRRMINLGLQATAGGDWIIPGPA
jgi:hypothetical protein